MRFTGQVAIVTGAYGGIGLAAARRLAAEGANLVLVGRDTGKLAEAQQRLQAEGSPPVLCSACDVGDENQVRATVDHAVSRFGRLDVVVNNAGVMIFKPLEEHTAEDWEKVLRVDLFGAFFFIKEAFRVMTNGGAIVNVSSIHAVETEPFVASYAAAKTALLSLTRSAALEGKPRNIRVNAVLPGAIETASFKTWIANMPDDLREQMIAATPMRRNGTPEDIAAAVVYFASPASSWVTGKLLDVDGGVPGPLFASPQPDL
jgi:NAD(P)-dependent dehydrogenase (short-subunit alcohol dehydrogenase family)